MALAATVDLFELRVIYRVFHPKTVGNTFSPSTNGKSPKIYCILGHRTSLHKFKKLKIILGLFSYHNGKKLEIKYRKENKNKKYIWKLINILGNTQYIKN